MKAQQIELHIDELVLHGFELRDNYAVGVALQNELQRLFTERGVPSPLSETGVRPDIKTAAANLNSRASANVIGTHIAQSIYGGMNK